MPKVKVWNDNIYPHSEMYKGEMITIGPKECIEMDWEEAIQFKGQFTGIKRLGNDQPDPKGFKMIRVEQLKEPLFKDTPLINHANGAVAMSKEELMAELAKFSHMRAKDDPTIDSKPADDGPTMAQLMARIQELEAKLPTKGKPGRPRKEA